MTFRQSHPEEPCRAAQLQRTREDIWGGTPLECSGYSEPGAFTDSNRLSPAIRSGQTTPSEETIADGIAVRVPVPEALVELRSSVDEVLLVEDDSMIEAMQLAFRHLGLVVEPAGAAGLAAAITYQQRFRGARVVTPLTAGTDA